MGAGKQTCGELAHFHKNAGKAPAGKNYAVKVNAGNHPRTKYRRRPRMLDIVRERNIYLVKAAKLLL